MSVIDTRLFDGIAYEGIYRFSSPRQQVTSILKSDPSTLLILLSGNYDATIATTTGRTVRVTASAGDVIYRPRGDTRTETSDAAHPAQCLVVLFQWPSSPPALPGMVHDRLQLIRNMADQLLLLRTRKARLVQGICQGLLVGILAEYMRLACVNETPMEHRVIDYIEAHLKDRITLSDLAQTAGLEPHHFCRKFAAVTGQTPMQMVRSIRMEHARGMLGGDHPWTLRKIAPRVGLANGNHLSRLLKQHFGAGARIMRK